MDSISGTNGLRKLNFHLVRIIKYIALNLIHVSLFRYKQHKIIL